MEPSPNGTNGDRDASGRFAKGNKGGPGNPFARRIGELRSRLLQAITDEDWDAIIKTIIERAKAGEQWAVREVLDRTLGKPVEADLVERIEQLESRLADKESR